ncbi:MAG: DUF1016 domain-containing protein, partial [Deltaproteobacteria bacterium]|nr:DUF1016 domain-containing protein [Deltaproteobacteria bacterium]
MKQIQNTENVHGYAAFLTEIKDRIQTAQVRANLAVNRELVALYWQIGQMISERQEHEGWGARVIDRLAQDLKNELPAVKGFSARNMRRMRQFYDEYPLLKGIAKELQRTEINDKKIWPQLEAKIAESSADA